MTTTPPGPSLRAICAFRDKISSEILKEDENEYLCLVFYLSMNWWHTEIKKKKERKKFRKKRKKEKRQEPQLQKCEMRSDDYQEHVFEIGRERAR